MNIKPKSSESGFTLVEVLIAAVILFAILSMTALAFKSARQSSESASQTIELYAPVPIILSNIKAQLQLQAPETLNGEGNVMGVNFVWSATTETYRPPIQRFDIDDNTFREYQPRFRLYRVELELEFGGKVKNLSYQEIAWHALARD